METIFKYFASADWNFETLCKTGLTLLIGSLLMAIFGRFIFGKRSALNHAVSSAIGIIFIIITTAILESIDTGLNIPLPQIPFITVANDQILFFSFFGAHYTEICFQLLSMMILAFLVNLADRWVPTGKNILTWVFFRLLTVTIAYCLHIVTLGILSTYIPADLFTYAPVILLGILVLLLMTGALKVPIGALLSTVNPVIGGLYTFFFATVIGKQITKSMISTAILAGFVILLHYLGITAIAVTGTMLLLALPFLLILFVLWYLIFKIL